MEQNAFETVDQFLQYLDQYEIEERRLVKLNALSNYVLDKIGSSKEVKLNFICTHNSRRSHLSQIWATVFADYYKIENVECFSGGTEATAIYPMVLKTIARQGLEVKQLSDPPNPHYTIDYPQGEASIWAFSKHYNHLHNPSSQFAAVLTCNSADKACPIVKGADYRLALPYTDPKEYDKTDLAEVKYFEKSIEIAREMNYIFRTVSEG